MNGLFVALASAAVTLGALHTLAPDHWIPFAACARAQGWSAGRTARVTLACGLGHVSASALLGLLGLLFGREMLLHFGHRMEALAGFLLVAFGLVYAGWGVRKAAGRKLHGHAHAHFDHVHEPGRMTARALFLLFSADPCVAVIPLLFAAAPLGTLRTLGVVLLYEAATLATMVGLVLPARAGARALRLPWLDHWGDATAGALIVVVGVTVAVLGI